MASPTRCSAQEERRVTDAAVDSPNADSQPFVGPYTRDLLEADLASMDEPLRQLLYADDKWDAPAIPTRVLSADSIGPVLVNRFTDIDDFWKSLPFRVSNYLDAPLRYRKARNNTEGDSKSKFLDALDFPIGHGALPRQQRSTLLLAEYEHARGERAGSDEKIPDRRRDKISIDDVDAQSIRIVNLSFIAHDYGQWMEIPSGLSRKPVSGGGIGKNQCAIIRCAGGGFLFMPKREKSTASQRRIRTTG